MSEEQALDELDLLIQEYDPEQSDWRFRKSVMMQLIERIRPATLRRSADSAELEARLALADELMLPGGTHPYLGARKRDMIVAALRARAQPQTAGWDHDADMEEAPLPRSQAEIAK